MGRPDACRSCGIEWIKHPGSELTCNRLNDAIELLEKFTKMQPCEIDLDGCCGHHDSSRIDSDGCKRSEFRALKESARKLLEKPK